MLRCGAFFLSLLLIFPSWLVSVRQSFSNRKYDCVYHFGDAYFLVRVKKKCGPMFVIQSNRKANARITVISSHTDEKNREKRFRSPYHNHIQVQHFHMQSVPNRTWGSRRYLHLLRIRLLKDVSFALKKYILSPLSLPLPLPLSISGQPFLTTMWPSAVCPTICPLLVVLRVTYFRFHWVAHYAIYCSLKIPSEGERSEKTVRPGLYVCPFTNLNGSKSYVRAMCWRR